MSKEILQDPAQLKAIVTGLSTSVFGITINSQQLGVWMDIAADFGIVIGAVVTLVLGVQSYLKNRERINK